jgi:hypothetical protein
VLKRLVKGLHRLKPDSGFDSSQGRSDVARRGVDLMTARRARNKRSPKLPFWRKAVSKRNRAQVAVGAASPGPVNRGQPECP